MPARIWTPEEIDEIRRLFAKNAPLSFLAMRFNCDVDTVAAQIAELGLTSWTRTPRPKPRIIQ